MGKEEKEISKNEKERIKEKKKPTSIIHVYMINNCVFHFQMISIGVLPNKEGCLKFTHGKKYFLTFSNNKHCCTTILNEKIGALKFTS